MGIQAAPTQANAMNACAITGGLLWEVCVLVLFIILFFGCQACVFFSNEMHNENPISKNISKNIPTLALSEGLLSKPE